MGLTVREPLCPRAPSVDELRTWQRWPRALQKRVPLAFVSEAIELYGDPLARALAEGATYRAGIYTRNYEEWGIPGAQQGSVGDVMIDRGQPTDGDMFVLALCGIDRVRQNRCEGYGLDKPEFWIHLGKDLKDSAEMAGKYLGTVLKAVGTIFSFIPGIGTVFSTLLTAVGGLVSGEPIGDALLDAATNALPGGKLVKEAFTAGVTFGTALIRGERFDEAAAEYGRSLAQRNGGPLAVAAYDTAIVVARAKSLQDVGFGVLSVFVKNGAPVKGWAKDVLDSYADKAARAAHEGRNVVDVLSEDLAKDVARVAGGAVLDRVVTAISDNPAFRSMPSDALASALGVAEEVARAGQAIMRDGSVDQQLYARLLGGEAAFAAKHGWKETAQTQKTIVESLEEKRNAALAAQAVIVRGTQLRDFLPGYMTPAERAADAAQPTPKIPPPLPAFLVGSTGGASSTPSPRHTLKGDLALAGVIALAAGAVVWWATAEKNRRNT